MSVSDREADENVVFTGEMPSKSLKALLICASISLYTTVDNTPDHEKYFPLLFLTIMLYHNGTV